MRVSRVGAALSLAAAIWMVAGSARVQGEAASPSVRQAARLKYNPPPNWIRHYLGDDRYKIAGGAWRVVSTETDTYYYPAWAPEMLRQSNGIVIGFPSSAAAEEAGYKRSKYPMDSPLLGLTGRPEPTPVPAPVAPGAASSPMGGFSIPAGAAPSLNKGKARRIMLTDGVSSTILPSGWSHLSHIERAPQSAQGRGPQEELLDFFFPGVPDPNVISNASKVRFIVIGSVVLPGANAEEMFGPRAAARMNRLNLQISNLNRVQRQNGRPGNIAPINTGMRAASFGNLQGVQITALIPEIGRRVPVSIAGRGSKAFFFISTAGRARNGNLILSGFRGR